MAPRTSTSSMVLLVVAAALALHGTAVAAQVVNGSFENVVIGAPYLSTDPADVPGWTHGGSAGDALLMRVGYVDGTGRVATTGQGSQFVIMGGGSGVFGTASWLQTLTGLTPGTTYLLSFMMAAEATVAGQQSITVDFPSGSPTSAQVFTSAMPTGNYWTDWTTQTLNFVAASSSVGLRFSTSTVYDVGLDAVRVSAVVSAVPEPRSLLLLASSLLPVLWLVRRRRNIG